MKGNLKDFIYNTSSSTMILVIPVPIIFNALAHNVLIHPFPTIQMQVMAAILASCPLVHFPYYLFIFTMFIFVNTCLVKHLK